MDQVEPSPLEKLDEAMRAESLRSKSSIADEHAKLLRLDPAAERRAVRKLDLCLIPIMAMFYFLSFLVSCFPIE